MGGLRLRILRLWILSVAFVQLGCGSLALSTVNVLARFGSYDVERDLAYGPDPHQRLDVYRPRSADAAKAPVVVFFYGGKWSNGDKGDYVFAAQALTAQGFVAVVPDYRKFPQVQFPDFVRDGARVVAWAREQADTFGGDPSALFVMGHSAGAHIAAMLTLDPSYLRAVGGGPEWLSGMIGLAGPYDFNARREDLRPIFAASPVEATQPLAFATRDPGVPFLLLHGDADRTVFKKNTVNLAAAITSAGGRVRTRYYPETDHTQLIAALSIPLRGRSSVLADLTAFIRGPTASPTSR